MEYVLRNSNVHRKSIKTQNNKIKKRKKPAVFLTDCEYKASKRNIGEQCKFESYCERLEQEEQIQDRNNQQTITILCSKDEGRRRRLGSSHLKPKAEHCTISVDCCERSFKMSRDNRNKLSSPTLTCCGICRGTQTTVHRYEAQRLQLENLRTGNPKAEGTSICLFSSDKDLELFMDLLEQEMEKLDQSRRNLQTEHLNDIYSDVRYDITRDSVHYADDTECHDVPPATNLENRSTTEDRSPKHSNCIPTSNRNSSKPPRRIRPQSSPLKSISATRPRPVDSLKHDYNLFYPTTKFLTADKNLQSPHAVLSSALSRNEVTNDKHISIIKEAMECLELDKNDGACTKIINNLRQKGYTNLEQLGFDS